MKNNFYDQDEEYCSHCDSESKKIKSKWEHNHPHSDNVYCSQCECLTSKPKYCRGCGKVLCAFCAKTDGMCKNCSRDAVEYVDENYRKSTTPTY